MRNNADLGATSEVNSEVMWGSAKDGGKGRKALLLACVLGLVALMVGGLFGNRGMLQLMQERERARRVEHQISDLRSENLQLAAEIRALRTQPRAIERLAREQLGLLRPGETVFVLQPESATPGH
jgi:cell division protein FtsB